MVYFLSKAMIRHRNFVQCIRSSVLIGKLDGGDVVVQMARCSFDAHVSEILGTLVLGGTLVLLRPRGNLDFDYVARTLREKQITILESVPTYLRNLFQLFARASLDFSDLNLKRIHCVGECNSNR